MEHSLCMFVKESKLKFSKRDLRRHIERPASTTRS